MIPKRLAYLSYFFPPIGGAGVQRSLKFARYLPESGWVPHVITVRDAGYWMMDPTLLEELPPEVEVIRTPAAPWAGIRRRASRRSAPQGSGPQGSARRSEAWQLRLRRIARWFLLPDPYAPWIPGATAAARRVLDDGGILLTTSSPDSAHIAGLRIARPGVGWVADFRDPWVRRMSYAPATPLHDWLQRRMERRVVERANRIVVTSDATREDFLRRYPALDPGKIAVVANGYDEADFPARIPEPDADFLILHPGQLNPERSIDPFLDGLERFFRARPDAESRTRVEFIGARYDSHERAAASRGFAARIRFRDPLPHREIVRELHRARVLLLVEQESDRGGLILPGKTFELVRAGRPVLAVVPRGAAWNLVTGLRAGIAATPSDPAGIAEGLAELFERYLQGLLEPICRPGEGIERYERRRLAADLARILDEVHRSI